MITRKKVLARVFSLIMIINMVLSSLVIGAFAADSDFSKLRFDYKLASPQKPSEFELYYSSENVVTSADSSWTEHFDSSYTTEGGAEAYLIFKAPNGKKFTKFYCESYCLGTVTPKAYSYTDISDISSECELPKSSKKITSYQGSWRRVNSLWALLPDNAKYIKLVLPESKNGGNWGRHITNLGFDVADDSEELYSGSVFNDELNPDENSGQMTDPYIYQMYKAECYAGFSGAEGYSIKRNSADGESYVVFQAPPGYKWKNFTLKTVNVETENYIDKFSCSETIDGVFKRIPAPAANRIGTQANWGVYTYTFTSLPKNTRYIKVEIPEVFATWAYQIDGFTTEFAKIDENIDEMKKIEYEYLNEEAPVRPGGDISSLCVNINDRKCDYIYTNSLGERIVMAPQGKQISYLAYTATKGSPGELYCSNKYTDGFKKAVVSEKNASNDCLVFEMDLNSADSGRAASSREATFESSMLPANSHYAKICGTSVSNIVVLFADDSEEITACETESNFCYYNVFDDDPYIYSYSNLNRSYIRESVTYNSKEYSYYGSLILKDGESDGEIVYGAPDNAFIKNFTFYIRNSGSKIVPDFYEVKKDGTENIINANITQMSTKLYEYSLPISADTVYVKTRIRAPAGDDTTRFRFVGYTFDWQGSPSNPSQAYKHYTLAINNDDAKQEIKGWGIFPSYYSESALTKFEDDECKDLLLTDFGANTARIELYSEYDRNNKALTGDNIQLIANQIKNLSNYGLDYIICIWSPPGSLKTNGKAQGYNPDGTWAELKDGCEEEFCDYIKLCLDTLVKLGCKKPLSISFANEAEGNAEWQACHFKTDRYVQVCKMLSKNLDDSGYGDVLIHGSESASLGDSFTMFGNDFSAFDDGDFNDALDVFAYHAYRGINPANSDKDTYKIAVDKIGDREIWQTEYTSINGNGVYDVTESMQKICRDTRLIGSNRWFWWNTYSTISNDGIIRNGDDGYVQTSTYKMLKAVYNGIPSGSKVCTYYVDDVQLADKASKTEATDITCNISTFKTPSGSAAIIVNDSNCNKTYDIKNIAGSEVIVTNYDPDTDTVTSRTVEKTGSDFSGLTVLAGNIVVVSSVNVMPNIKYGFSFDEKNERVGAKVKFENYNGSNLDMYLCAYKGSQLIDVNWINAEISSDIQTADISVSYSGADRVELFVWKGKNLVPVCEKISAFCPN